MRFLNQLINTTITLVVFFVLLFAYTKLAGPIPFNISSVTTSKADSFQVSGEGKSSIKPDTATVTAGVSAQGETAKEAQDQMNKNINKVIAAVKALGIDAADIKTENYSVNPGYNYLSGEQKITGYSANTNISIKVKNIDLVNQVVDTATANGANVIGGAQFENMDKAKAEDEARTKAIVDAKNKATQIAKAGGFNLGRLIGYQEGANGVPRAYVSADSLATGGLTKVEPGTNEITITVTLSYEVR